MKISSVIANCIVRPVVILLLISSAVAQPGVRTEINFPDIGGYVTLKCDFHMHTVFSDGNVWPHIRVQEAWLEGLDAISITDHIEYKPHRDDVRTDHDRPYDLAKGAAAASHMILIRGTEITRSEPQGHHNALFITDADAIEIDDFESSMREAVDQGGFITWNHPGWKQPGGRSVWYPEQGELLEKELLHGLEVVNGRTYYPNAHKWCLEKNLTMVGVSDVHGLIYMDYDFAHGGHRPMTLVFAAERSEAAINEALVAGRTAIWWNNILIGRKEYLEPLFHGSLEITPEDAVTISGGSGSFMIHNRSDVTYELEQNGDVEGFSIPGGLTLHAGKTVLVRIGAGDDAVPGSRTVRLPYVVKNLYVQPNEGMPVEIPVTISIGGESR